MQLYQSCAAAGACLVHAGCKVGEQQVLVLQPHAQQLVEEAGQGDRGGGQGFFLIRQPGWEGALRTALLAAGAAAASLQSSHTLPSRSQLP